MKKTTHHIQYIAWAICMALFALLPCFSSIPTYVQTTRAAANPEYSGALASYILLSEPGYVYYQKNEKNVYTDTTDVRISTEEVNGKLIQVYTIYTTKNITVTKNVNGTTSLTYKIQSGETTEDFFAEDEQQKTITDKQNVTVQALKNGQQYFKFQIIFVDVYNYSNNSYAWFSDEGATQSIDQPESDSTFANSSLTLKFNNAQTQTQNGNDLQINYTLNGTTFTATYTNKDASVEDNNKITFSKSGNYVVEIYDQTYTPEAKALGKQTNYKKYTFSVENGVYALTFAENNAESYFTANQYTDSNVVIQLKGAQNADTYYFKAVNQENVEDVYVTGTLNKYNNFQYTFTEHGDYIVYIYAEETMQTSILSSQFHIIKKLMDQMPLPTGEGVTNTILSTDTNTHVQTIQTTVQKTEPFEGNIQTITSYSFTYRYAYTNDIPKFVTNVGNNQRIAGAVTLKPQTTGKFIVEINYNGTTHTWEYNPNDAESLTRTFDAVGKYSLRLTDEFGRSITYNFEIYKPMDAASIALIVISSVIAVAIIVVIIVARTRLNVR